VILLDASAILAYLWAEPGSAAVARVRNDGGAACTLVNWAEVATKVFARGEDWLTAQHALSGLGLTFVALDPVDAVAAARLWLAHPSLSLGDRLCLAVGTRLGATILTADRAWAEVSDLVQVLRSPADDDAS